MLAFKDCRSRYFCVCAPYGIMQCSTNYLKDNSLFFFPQIKKHEETTWGRMSTLQSFSQTIALLKHLFNSEEKLPDFQNYFLWSCNQSLTDRKGRTESVLKTCKEPYFLSACVKRHLKDGGLNPAPPCHESDMAGKQMASD